MTRRLLICLFLIAACSVISWSPLRARAEDGASKADALFRAGKERLAQGFYPQACAMFAESYKLDPATGSLLALALCHEREGKLASAHDDYLAAAERAHAEGQLAREDAARTRAFVLSSQRSRITIEAQAASLAGGTLRLNGTAVPLDQLNTPLPIDGGVAYLDFSLDNQKLWSTQLNIQARGDRVTARIPTSISGPARAPKPQAAPAQKPRHPSPPSKNQTAKWVSVGLWSAGGVALGIGFGLTLRAILKNSDSDAGCVGDVCHGKAREERLEARRAGNAATVSLTLGSALAVGGLVTYLLGHRHQDRRNAASKPSGRLSTRASAPAWQLALPTPWMATHGGGASLQGHF